MNSKERFDFMKGVAPEFFKRTEDELINDLVNDLIKALFIPTKGERLFKVDKDRLLYFDINEKEPINWGDLQCSEIKKFEDGSFLITIEEASPKLCPTFCWYITEFMKSYGWEVRVETEW